MKYNGKDKKSFKVMYILTLIRNVHLVPIRYKKYCQSTAVYNNYSSTQQKTNHKFLPLNHSTELIAIISSIAFLCPIITDIFLLVTNASSHKI